MNEPALFAALPAARQRVAWMPVGRFPTRVQRCEGLGPRGLELWVKRDDESGELYGGNKVRKLEFLFGEARARGRSRLVTFGGWGSHHVVATSIYGPRHGFTLDAALFPQPIDDHVREQLLVGQAVGTRLIPVRSILGVLPTLSRALVSRDAAWLSGGGSSAIGTLGYVSAGFELLQQVRDGALPPFDVVYGALGSCGTIAGLLWSLWAKRPIEIVGVRIVDSAICGALYTRALAHSIDRVLGPLARGARSGVAPLLRIETRFGGRYGEATAESMAAVTAAARAGLRLDPIYTGKVLAALLADARSGRLHGKRVLFLHSHNTVDLRPLYARAPGLGALPGSLGRRLQPEQKEPLSSQSET